MSVLFLSVLEEQEHKDNLLMCPTKASWFVYVNFEKKTATRDQRNDIKLSVKIMFRFLTAEQFNLLGISLNVYFLFLQYQGEHLACVNRV